MTEDVPLRRIFRVVNGGTPTSEDENWDGNIFWATPIDLASMDGGFIQETSRTLTRDGLKSGSASVPAGSLILSTRAPIGYVAETTTETAFNQGCRGLTPQIEIDTRFFRYQLLARRPDLVSLGQGSTFAELSSDALATFKVHCPPLRKQREAADFLDAETARIDALIHKKRTTMALLEERWRAAVQLRLDQLEPVVSLKRRWRVIDCKHRTPTYVEDGYPVVSPGDLAPGRVDISRANRFVGETDFADLTEGRRPKRGDIIYSRNASAGTAAYVETDAPFCMGQDVCLVTSEREDGRFLMYALNSLASKQLAPLKIGSTITRINVDQIAQLRVPAPPADVQRRVADELDAAQRRKETLISRLARQIDLLREHRQALITAAITGQLEIGKAAA